MPNVKLSAAELALACNADILLTKNTIIEKVYDLFGRLSASYIDILKAEDAFRNFNSPSAKISKGENYRGLPWVMLDYPRVFSDEQIFSVRTMFWWGHHFSQFLILKGTPLPESTLIPDLIQKGTIGPSYLCIAGDPWQHHFEADNMIPASSLTNSQITDQVNRSGFLKLGTKIPIDRWESVENIMSPGFKNLLDIAAAGM